MVKILFPGKFDGKLCWLHPECYRMVIAMTNNEEVAVPMSCISELNMAPQVQSKDEDICFFKPAEVTKEKVPAHGVAQVAGSAPKKPPSYEAHAEELKSATSKAAAKKKVAPTHDDKKMEASKTNLAPAPTKEDLKINLHDRQPAHTNKCEENIEP
jgi:hypothetical protein